MHRSHAQSALLRNGLQLVGADGLCDQVQLLAHGLVAKGHADVGDVGAPDVIALLTLFNAIRAKPGSLHLRREAKGVKHKATDSERKGQSVRCFKSNLLRESAH